MKATIGVVLAAIAMFVWGSIFWMGLYPDGVTRTVEDDSAAQAVLAEYFPEPGVYAVPGQEMETEAWAERHRTGPVAQVMIAAGREPMAPAVFIKGFLHFLGVAALLALLLKLVSPSLRNYAARFGFVVLAGVTASVYFNLALNVWWHWPMEWLLWNGLYDIVSWAMAGLVLAALVRDRSMDERQVFT